MTKYHTTITNLHRKQGITIYQKNTCNLINKYPCPEISEEHNFEVTNRELSKEQKSNLQAFRTLVTIFIGHALTICRHRQQHTG